MPAFSVIIRDESVPRSHVVEQILELANVPLTARDLISERVRAECDRQQAGSAGHAPLVTPNPEERARNAAVPATEDWTKGQIEQALASFSRNGFILLVDNIQVEALDTPLSLTETSIVTFLKLTPLKGG